MVSKIYFTPFLKAGYPARAHGSIFDLIFETSDAIGILFFLAQDAQRAEPIEDIGLCDHEYQSEGTKAVALVHVVYRKVIFT